MFGLSIASANMTYDNLTTSSRVRMADQYFHGFTHGSFITDTANITVRNLSLGGDIVCGSSGSGG